MKDKRLALVFFVLSVVVSCTTKKDNNATTTDTTSFVAPSVEPIESVTVSKDFPSQQSEEIAKDTVLDNAARFIAGMPQLTDNSYSILQNDTYWQEYKASMDENWKRIYDTRLSKMAAWEKNTFSHSIEDSLALFYPFSGPDFLHAFYLFPHAKEFVMVALEPVRKVEPLDIISEKDRDEFLDSLGNSLRDIFLKSYFITNHMQTDLKQVKGVLPPLYFFIERSGHELLTEKFFTLHDDVTEKEVKGSQIHWEKTPAVKLTFRDRASREVKTLYYFSIDISNAGLRNRTPFIKFMQQRAPFNTFVKSASYLMHKDAFTQTKELILKNSHHIFQDDTGMPYKYFKNKLEWKGQFYGEYIKPVESFSSELYQRDLDSAFRAGVKNELPFSLGYHWSTKKQNYMLFSRAKLSANR